MSIEETMADYSSRVERLAAKRTGEPVYNESLEHATVILRNMFAHAQHSVKILTGELNQAAYGTREIVDEARRFLQDPEHTIFILYEDDVLSDEQSKRNHPFLRAVEGQDRIQMRLVPKDFQDRYAFHFVLMDEDSYRFEPNKQKFGAVAAFGDNEGGNNLGRLFEEIWEASSE